MGITIDGERDVLGLWVGPSGGEGAKQWMGMLTELRNRGVADVCIVCCDGLKGLPEAIAATWPLATIQTCVVHLEDQRLEEHPEHPGDHLRRPPQHPLSRAHPHKEPDGPAGGGRGEVPLWHPSVQEAVGSGVVGCSVAGPGCDFSEASMLGFESAALELVVAPGLPSWARWVSGRCR